MQKICHVTSAHFTNDVRIFKKECISLANAGYETVLVGKGESREEKGVQVVGMGPTPAGRIARMFKFSKVIVKKAVEINADIYHLHDPELLRYVNYLKRKGKIVIFDSHENVCDSIADKEYIPKNIRRIVQAVYRVYEKSILRKCDAVISVTPHICDYLRTINDNVWQITNYPILEDVVEKEKQIGHICFAGGISPQWNHENIISAINESSVVKEYELYGRGEVNYLNELRKCDSNSKMKYKGMIPHDEVKDKMAACQCGIAICAYNNNMGRRRGSLGNTKLFEYMMAGIPVICTDYELWKEIIERHDCGICVSPNSVEEIRRAIENLIENPIDSDKMGKRGRLAVEQEYNWAQEEKKLIELYAQVAG